jgi:hypothetical protein
MGSSHKPKNENGSLSYTSHKNQHKIDKKPKHKPETINPEENIDEKLHDFGGDFLNITPEAQDTKAKGNKRDNINDGKNQQNEMDGYLKIANYVSHKRLLPWFIKNIYMSIAIKHN